jgi:hypothetical protein
MVMDLMDAALIVTALMVTDLMVTALMATAPMTTALMATAHYLITCRFSYYMKSTPVRFFHIQHCFMP